jgi:alpha-1,2-mannosyltransferase
MNRLARFLAGMKPMAPWAGGLMWAVWIVSVLFGPGNLDLNGQVIGTDHSAFHTAAILLDDGLGNELYDFPELTVFARRQDELIGKLGFLDPFRNPPCYALIYLPTAKLPYLASFVLWAMAGLLGLTAGLYLIVGRRFFRALGWSLTFYPVFAAVSFGQNSLLSFGIFGLVYRLLMWERRFLGGLAAGLLLFKPQLLMGLGAWWLLDIRRYWPSLIGLAMMAALMAGASFLLVPEETIAWANKLPDIARYDAFDFYNLHNPRGFGALLTGSKTVGNWFGLAGFGLALLCFARFRRRHGSEPAIIFAAAVCATLWGSPHTMTYEWALAVIPAAILWERRPDLRSALIPLFALAWLVLFVSTPFTKAQLSVTGFAIQLSVPILALLAIKIDRLLRQRFDAKISVE